MESRQRRAVERGRIIGMREAGHSISEIARDLGLTRQTVQRWLTRWEESGNLEDRPRSGKPKMTSAEDTAGIRAAVERNPFTNSVSVREQLGLESLDVSDRTIRRRLHESRIHHHVPATKGGIPLRQHFGNMWHATLLHILSAIPLVQQEATYSMRLCGMQHISTC
ncbi:hypothetical protein Pmani_010230 [Petrolisthes manimaculis]|uniref:Transposase n=1 Tax=Petrolisthes manimaculis TaxID=1843537 RepID=A0AAE1Q5H2_9EUCA|nr:hypothetical protein Pmani_010230 [Petrolisthes manimaculis]